MKPALKLVTNPSPLNGRSRGFYHPLVAEVSSEPKTLDLSSGNWLAWPADAEFWKQDLEAAQSEFVTLCRAIVDVDPVLCVPRGETLHVLVSDSAQLVLAEERLRGLGVKFHLVLHGEDWVRETAPLFALAASAPIDHARFPFQGWAAIRLDQRF